MRSSPVWYRRVDVPVSERGRCPVISSFIGREHHVLRSRHSDHRPAGGKSGPNQANRPEKAEISGRTFSRPRLVPKRILRKKLPGLLRAWGLQTVPTTATATVGIRRTGETLAAKFRPLRRRPIRRADGPLFVRWESRSEPALTHREHYL